MRSIMFCLVIVLAVATASAQITVPKSTVEELFTAGNPLRIYFGTSSTDTTIDVGQMGAERVYDFSTVSFTLFKVDTVKQVTEIPYLASRYPAGGVALNFGGGPGSNFHPIFIIQGNEILLPGNYEEYTVDSLSVGHSNPYELFLRFPVTFGDSDQRVSTITDSIFVQGALSGTMASDIPINYVVDGWGTLKLQGGEEHPCLRLRWYEDPLNYEAKDFRFVTDNGIILHIGTTNDEPDEGEVALDGEVLMFRNTPITSVSEQSVPGWFMFSQNYPNPFNPATNFEFRIADFGLVSLKVYDIFGREVATPVNRELSPGAHRAAWDASGFPSGVYFYTLRAGGFVQTRKLLLVK